MQWKFEGVVVRLVIDLGEFVKVALKRGGRKGGGWGRSGMGAAGFCACLGVFLLL
jgi:hypothetical protein